MMSTFILSIPVLSEILGKFQPTQHNKTNRQVSRYMITIQNIYQRSIKQDGNPKSIRENRSTSETVP